MGFGGGKMSLRDTGRMENFFFPVVIRCGRMNCGLLGISYAIISTANSVMKG